MIPKPVMSRPLRPVRPFTGWHMLAIMVAFFGVVIAVNLTMARYALSTFSGEVVENSYVASQRFNGWLDQAHDEQALGWQAGTRLANGVVTVMLTDRNGAPLTTAKLSAQAAHPLGVPSTQTLTFVQTRPGVYAAPLRDGRWQVQLDVQSGGHRYRRMVDLTDRATP